MRRAGAFLASPCRKALGLNSGQRRPGLRREPAPGRPGNGFHVPIVTYGCGPYGTVRGVTGTQSGQESREPHVEWLTPNPFDGKQPVFLEQGSPWHITPHWALIDGKAMMVGLDIRSFTEHWVEYPDDPFEERIPMAPGAG